MSCGAPEVDPQALMPKRTRFDKSKRCIKCKTDLGNIVIRHAVYCKSCFTSSVTTKFRRSLESHINDLPDRPRKHELKAPGTLMIAFSGDLGSTVLLHLLHRCYLSMKSHNNDSAKGGKNHPRKHPIWPIASVCYVEECNAFPQGQIRNRTADIQAALEAYDCVEFIPLRLELAFDKRWWRTLYGDSNEIRMQLELASANLELTPSTSSAYSDPAKALQTYLATLPTQTAVRSAVHTLTRLVLLHTARSKQASHLVFGTSLTSFSISLINSIVQGAGFNVREESYEEWTPPMHYENATTSLDIGDQNMLSFVAPVRIVRPLKDVGMKECAAWAWWNNLKIVGREMHPGLVGKHTIQSLTNDFIVGLERDYPSTVSTIARTCEKLTPRGTSDNRCLLCERPVQKYVQDWKSRISVLSLDKPELKRATDTTTTTVKPPTSQAVLLTPHLCYACHTTLTSRSPRSSQRSTNVLGNTTQLPVWTDASLNASNEAVTSEAWRVMPRPRDDLRDTIGPFLLEE